jgi:hypothetical protein
MAGAGDGELKESERLAPTASVNASCGEDDDDDDDDGAGSQAPTTTSELRTCIERSSGECGAHRAAATLDGVAFSMR